MSKKEIKKLFEELLDAFRVAEEGNINAYSKDIPKDLKTLTNIVDDYKERLDDILNK